MRTTTSRLSSLVFLLLLTVNVVYSCVDVLFVLDPTTEVSRHRATKVASELSKRDGLRSSVVVRRPNGHYVFMMTKKAGDLITTLDTLDGDYDHYLTMVTSEIMRRRHVRPLVILLFSETAVNSSLSSTWKQFSRDKKVHVFRVGTAKPSNELSADEGESFEEILSCSAITKPLGDVRRRPAISEVEQSSTTVRPRTLPFSKTTRRPTTTRINPHSQRLYDSEWSTKVYLAEPLTSTTSPSRMPVTTTGPKLHPVFHHKVPSQEEIAAQDLPSDGSSAFSEKNSAPLKVLSKRFSTTTRPTTTRRTTAGPTTTTVKTPPGCVADIIFAMDFSDGTGDKSRHYLDIAAAAVGRLPISANAARVALVRYSGPGRAETLFHLDKHSNKDDVIEEMFRMESTGGTTRTGEAIQHAAKEFGNRKHGARKNARKFIVVFTDGYSQEDPTAAAEAARAEGITILTVSVEDDRLHPNLEELVLITGRKDMILISPNGQQLRDKILGNQCHL